jgi:signal peptidase I
MTHAEVAAAPAMRGNWLSTLWAAMLSLILPGAGQAYARRYAAAWRFAILAVALRVVASLLPRVSGASDDLPVMVLGLGLADGCLHLAAAVHAGWSKRRSSAPGRPGWRRSTWTWSLVLLALQFGLPELGSGYGYGLHSYSTSSQAMLPTLRQHERFIALENPMALAAIEPGDVILFRGPDGKTPYVKRLVGLPGQTVAMQGGRLVIDGGEVPREDLGPDGAGMRRWRLTLPNGRSFEVLKREEGSPLDDSPATRLGTDELFVLGDNLDNSVDSRLPDRMGPVRRDRVLGRASLIFWSDDLSRIAKRVR